MNMIKTRSQRRRYVCISAKFLLFAAFFRIEYYNLVSEASKATSAASNVASTASGTPSTITKHFLTTPAQGAATTINTPANNVTKADLHRSSPTSLSHKISPASSPSPHMGGTSHSDSLRTRQKPKTIVTTTTTTSSRRMSFLRIQREWKDAVKAGVAFDWQKGEPVRSKRSKKSATTILQGINGNDSDSNNGNITSTTSASSSHVWIGPLDNQAGLFLWHFTVTGLPGSVFETGVYHGRVILPPDYPATPPRVQMWTPSGRFMTRKDICLSASQYHPETWQPASWSVRTLVESLRLHMVAVGPLEIGGLAESYDLRLQHARASRHWKQRITSTVVVNHERMIQLGYLPPLPWSTCDADEQQSTEVGSTATIASDVGVPINRKNTPVVLTPSSSKKKRRRKKHRQGNTLLSESSSLLVQQKALPEPSLWQVFRQTFDNPVRLGLVLFLIVFCVLNLS